MSKFRSKADEILEAGVAERGNFAPTGAPKRVYNYWLYNSSSRKARDIRDGFRKENFCHFWRVVAIWAPMLWAGTKTMDFLESKTAAVLAAALFVFGIGFAILNFGSIDWFLYAGWVLAILAGIAFAVASVIFGISLSCENDEERWDSDLPEYKYARWGKISPITWAVYGLAKAMDAGHGKTIGLTLVGVALFGFSTLIVVVEGFLVLATVLGGAALLIGAMFGAVHAASWLGEIIRGRRSVKEAKRAIARQEALDNGYVLEAREPREPGKVAKFFTGLGDFFILITQVIRTKKWKICPLVEVDSARVDNGFYPW